MENDHHSFFLKGEKLPVYRLGNVCKSKYACAVSTSYTHAHNLIHKFANVSLKRFVTKADSNGSRKGYSAYTKSSVSSVLEAPITPSRSNLKALFLL